MLVLVLIWASIRLKLLNEMGFTLSSTPENNATVKLLIRKSQRTTQPPGQRGFRPHHKETQLRHPGNEAKADVHPVTIERSRSKAYYANLVWGLASE